MLGADPLHLGQQLVDLGVEVPGVGREGVPGLRLDRAQLLGGLVGHLLDRGQVVPDVLVAPAVVMAVVVPVVVVVVVVRVRPGRTRLGRAGLRSARLRSARLGRLVPGLGRAARLAGPGQVHGHDLPGVLAGTLQQLGEEVVVAAAVVDGQLGVGQRGGVGRGALVGMRIGRRTVDDRGDLDLVTTNGLDHAAPDVGRGHHLDLGGVAGRVATGAGGAAARREGERGQGKTGQRGPCAAVSQGHPGAPRHSVKLIMETVVEFSLEHTVPGSPTNG